jgi:ABC-type transporter Mla subunit MlaD
MSELEALIRDMESLQDCSSALATENESLRQRVAELEQQRRDLLDGDLKARTLVAQERHIIADALEDLRTKLKNAEDIIEADAAALIAKDDALEGFAKMQPVAWTTQQNLDELRSRARSSLSGWFEPAPEDDYVVPLYRKGE